MTQAAGAGARGQRKTKGNIMAVYEYVGHAGKTKSLLPNGQAVVVGDIFDAEEFDVKPSRIQAWLNGKLISESNKTPTITKGKTSIEKTIEAVDAHKYPSETWTNAALREFLDVNEVDYNPRANKAELLSLCQGVEPE